MVRKQASAESSMSEIPMAIRTLMVPADRKPPHRSRRNALTMPALGSPPEAQRKSRPTLSGKAGMCRGRCGMPFVAVAPCASGERPE